MSLSHSASAAAPPPVRGSHGLMKPRRAGTIKAAVASMYETLGPGFLAKVGNIIGRKSSQAQRYADEDADSHLRIDQLEALLINGAGVEVVAHLALRAGYVLTPIESANAAQISAAVEGLSREFGELFGDYVAALGDGNSPGRVDPAEARRLFPRAERVRDGAGQLCVALLAAAEEKA
jgi:hypothetical protein